VRAGVVNQNASVGKRRRAKDCPPYLPQRRPGGRFRRRARQSASGLALSRTLRAVRGASVNAPAGLGLRRQAQRDPTYQ